MKMECKVYDYAGNVVTYNPIVRDRKNYAILSSPLVPLHVKSKNSASSPSSIPAKRLHWPASKSAKFPVVSPSTVKESSVPNDCGLG